MSRTAASFKQADLERAIKGARASKLPIIRTEITKTGTITLFHENEQPQPVKRDLEDI